MIFLTLGAALIAAPVFAAPGGRTGDADGNGVLTRAEAQAHATDRFAKMDTNKDGKIDAADRQAARAAMQAKRFAAFDANSDGRSEEHTSELQSLMRISYAVFCLKKKKKTTYKTQTKYTQK